MKKTFFSILCLSFSIFSYSQDIILPQGNQIRRHQGDNFTYQNRSMCYYGIGWQPDSWNIAGNSLWMSAFGGIKFFTEKGYSMGINAKGNVGIGTDNPQYKLDVNGTVAIADLYLKTRVIDNGWRKTYIDYDGHALIIGSKPGAYCNNQLVLRPGGSSSGKLNTTFEMYNTLSDNTFQHKVRIASDANSFFNGGNIGIGTEDPTAKLHVNGDLKAQALYLENSFFNSSGGYARIYYPGVSLMIGTQKNTATDCALDIRPGDIETGTRQSIITMWQAGANNTFEKKNQFRTNGVSYFNGGNVGIGTDNPIYKLDVAGNIRATEVNIEALPWADFVFDKDYKLPTLDEVENHINTHKHLPDIPSEKDVKENGISIGEMQAKLLQKIEELTLYVIQQDKTIKDLKEQVDELQTK